jgi:hypothetical protein
MLFLVSGLIDIIRATTPEEKMGGVSLVACPRYALGLPMELRETINKKTFHDDHERPGTLPGITGPAPAYQQELR